MSKAPAVAVTPDGSQIVTAGADGSVGIWDRASIAPVATLTGHTARPPRGR